MSLQHKKRKPQYRKKKKGSSTKARKVHRNNYRNIDDTHSKYPYFIRTQQHHYNYAIYCGLQNDLYKPELSIKITIFLHKSIYLFLEFQSITEDTGELKHHLRQIKTVSQVNIKAYIFANTIRHHHTFYLQKADKIALVAKWISGF